MVATTELMEDLNILKDIEMAQQLEPTELKNFNKNIHKQDFA